MKAQRIRKDLADGEARALSLRFGNETIPVVILFKDGRYFAYRNECRHLPVALNLAGMGFWSDDGKYLECRSHGARYEPATGTCVEGPCVGARLEALSVREEKDSLVIQRS